jgi:hypothetical protein
MIKLQINKVLVECFLHSGRVALTTVTKQAARANELITMTALCQRRNKNKVTVADFKSSWVSGKHFRLSCYVRASQPHVGKCSHLAFDMCDTACSETSDDSKFE